MPLNKKNSAIEGVYDGRIMILELPRLLRFVARHFAGTRKFFAQKYISDAMIACRFEHITYQQVLEQELAVMDLTAIVLCKENALPLVVFDASESRTLTRLASGEQVGTRVDGDETDVRGAEQQLIELQATLAHDSDNVRTVDGTAQDIVEG